MSASGTINLFTKTIIMENLIEGLQSQMNRVREIIKVYEELPNNAGAFASGMMQFSISNAEKMIASSDTKGMIMAYKDLESYEL
jgi:hypothetical protein